MPTGGRGNLWPSATANCSLLLREEKSNKSEEEKKDRRLGIAEGGKTDKTTLSPAPEENNRLGRSNFCQSSVLEA